MAIRRRAPSAYCRGHCVCS